MSAYVYILGSHGAGGYRTYVGWTLDLERRLGEHNGAGPRGAKSTRGRAWRLLYAERCADASAAMQREWRLKRDRAFRRKLTHSARADWPEAGVGREDEAERL